MNEQLSLDLSRRGRRSRRKGGDAERELAAALTALGLAAVRLGWAQGRLGRGCPDVAIAGAPVHLEAKRVEATRLGPALEQAARDAQPGQLPVVAHRRSRQRWVLSMDLETFAELIRRAWP